jgi:hypothetical protein
MEWEDVRLLPAKTLLAVSGVAAMMLAVESAISGLPSAPVFAALALILLAAAGPLAPDRRWSFRLGSVAAWAAIPVWLASLIALDHPIDLSTGLFCVGMMVAAGWTSRFLGAELEPPEWMGGYEAADRASVSIEGWIEELTDDSALALGELG